MGTTGVISVETAEGTYPVMVRAGLLADLGNAVRQCAPHNKALLAVDAAVQALHGEQALESLRQAGYQVTVHVIEASESLKTLNTVHAIYQRMVSDRLERSSPVVALGGGIVGDVAGFAAATWLRGVPLVQVPTTLLAMVDASLGGKTGVNFPTPGGTPGKNLVGAFWQPRAVVIDPLVLDTLDDRHLRCGLAECVKHGIIADAALLDFIESSLPDILARDAGALSELIVRSAGVKAAIVSRDVREAGDRALLNLGHTFAHAIEPIESLDLHHGEAVAVGLVAAAHCAVSLDLLARAEADRITRLLKAIGLPTTLPAPVACERLLSMMLYDKKVQDGRVRLVVPTGPGSARILDAVDRPVVETAWRAVGAGG